MGLKISGGNDQWGLGKRDGVEDQWEKIREVRGGVCTTGFTCFF